MTEFREPTALLPAPRAPPIGSNGARIRAIQHRVLSQLARSRIISSDDAAAASFAADVYATAVADGVLPAKALEAARTTSGQGAMPLTLTAALETQCGLDLEMSAEVRARR